MNIALIGSRIGKSLSPALYAGLFSEHKIDGNFSLISILPDELRHIRAIVEDRDLNAFAVTMPYKQAIMQYLDVISESARAADSVNLVTIYNNEWTGYSTDGIGFIRGLQADNIDFENRRILLYGSGGAASALLSELKKHTKHISICGRNAKKAAELADRFGVRLADAFSPHDIFINATPLGSAGYDDFANFDFVKNFDTVCDLVYSPKKTKLLKAAEAQGKRIQNGLPMLREQARVAFGICRRES
jgi:shikimate dehydrogenase